MQLIYRFRFPGMRPARARRSEQTRKARRTGVNAALALDELVDRLGVALVCERIPQHAGPLGSGVVHGPGPALSTGTTPAKNRSAFLRDLPFPGDFSIAIQVTASHRRVVRQARGF